MSKYSERIDYLAVRRISQETYSAGFGVDANGAYTHTPEQAVRAMIIGARTMSLIASPERALEVEAKTWVRNLGTDNKTEDI